MWGGGGGGYRLFLFLVMSYCCFYSGCFFSSREKCVVLRVCDQGEPARENPRKMAHDHRSDFAELCSPPKMRGCVNCNMAIVVVKYNL